MGIALKLELKWVKRVEKGAEGDYRVLGLAVVMQVQKCRCKDTRACPKAHARQGVCAEIPMCKKGVCVCVHKNACRKIDVCAKPHVCVKIQVHACTEMRAKITRAC